MPAGLLLSQGADRVLAEDDRAGQAQLLEVLLDHPAGVAVLLHEDGACGAARERLQAHRAGSREDVEDARLLDRADDVEHRLAHAVAGRPRDDALRRRDPVALSRAGDDPHVGARTARPAEAAASASLWSYTSIDSAPIASALAR